MRAPSLLSRLSAFALAGAAAAALVPGTAHAATVAAAGGEVTFAAATGEANHVTVTPWPRGVRITDDRTDVAAGAGCLQLGSHSVACRSTSLSADLGDGSDAFDSTAADVPARVAARDGEIDTVACGGGIDSVVADVVDVVSGCEGVDLPVVESAQNSSNEGGLSGGGGGDAPPAPDPVAAPLEPVGPAGSGNLAAAAPAANAVPPVIPEQTVKVSPSGVASVRVSCPADSGGCRGVVALEQVGRGAAVASAAAAGSKHRATVLGKAKFSAEAGTSPIVKVRLSKRGRQRILRSRRGRSRFRIKVTTRSADGRSVVTTQTVTLRPPKRSRRK